jgi:polyketide cyclase/dehydrase/lipid transport protein
MSEVSAEIAIDADLKEVWDTYFDAARWHMWVDGFDSVLQELGFPDAGGNLRWRSIPAGRGEVSERVLAHEPRRLHKIAFSDPESSGELTTTFEIKGDRVRVERLMSYEIERVGLFTAMTDFFFVRRQVQSALERELGSLKREAEASA